MIAVYSLRGGGSDAYERNREDEKERAKSRPGRGRSHGPTLEGTRIHWRCNP